MEVQLDLISELAIESLAGKSSNLAGILVKLAGKSTILAGNFLKMAGKCYFCPSLNLSHSTRPANSADSLSKKRKIARKISLLIFPTRYIPKNNRETTSYSRNLFSYNFYQKKNSGPLRSSVSILFRLESLH